MSCPRLFFHLPALLFFVLISPYSAKSEDAAANNNYGDGSTVPAPIACNNCTICQYPCHTQPPPPPPVDQSYAAPPPPSVNCPPAAPVICCGGGGGQYYAPPTPFYHPYNNYSGGAVQLQLSALLRPLTVSLYCVSLLIGH